MNYITKATLVKKNMEIYFMKLMKSIDFSYKEDKNDIVINEYYFNGVPIPLNIEFQNITLSIE